MTDLRALAREWLGTQAFITKPDGQVWLRTDGLTALLERVADEAKDKVAEQCDKMAARFHRKASGALKKDQPMMWHDYNGRYEAACDIAAAIRARGKA